MSVKLHSRHGVRRSRVRDSGFRGVLPLPSACAAPLKGSVASAAISARRCDPADVVMVSRPGSPPDPGLQCSRVSIAVYLDLVECVGDLAQVVCGEFDGGPAQVLLEPVQLGRSRDRHDPRLMG